MYNLLTHPSPTELLILFIIMIAGTVSGLLLSLPSWNRDAESEARHQEFKRLLKLVRLKIKYESARRKINNFSKK